MGNLISSIDPNGTSGTYSYRADYLLESITLTNGAEVQSRQMRYDPVGTLLWASDDGVITEYNLTDPTGATAGYVETEHFSDPYGLVWNQTTHEGGSVRTARYTHDVMQRQTSVTTPSGYRTSYAYNELGELVGVPGLVDLPVSYDQIGRLAGYTTVNGVTTNRGYDENSRLSLLSYATPAGELKRYAFTYDGADNIRTRGGNSYQYDAAERLATAFLYDGFHGEPEELEQDTGQVLNDVLAEDEIDFTITELEFSLDYHAASLGANLGQEVAITEVTLVPSAVLHRVEERHLELLVASINQERAWVELEDYEHRTGEDGSITFVLRRPVRTRFVKVHSHWNELDEANQPVDASTFRNATEEILTVTYLVNLREERYGYDAKGNRLTRTVATDLTDDSSVYSYYPESDRLKSDGTYGYRYDANGNLIEKGTEWTDNGTDITIDSTTGEYWAYEYDLFNRMIRANTLLEGTVTTVAEYVYDHMGYRVRRVGDDSEGVDAVPITTLYSFDTTGRVIEETTGGETTVYSFAFGRHLAKTEGYGTPEAASYFYLTDHLGTTSGLTDSTGLLIWDDDASPFGDASGAAGWHEEVLKYTGKDRDPATGLYYSNARFYDSATGRFTSEDPIRDGWNWYQYVRSNPLVFVDPDGLEIIGFSDREDMNTALPPNAKLGNSESSLFEEYGCYVVCKANALFSLQVLRQLESFAFAGEFPFATSMSVNSMTDLFLDGSGLMRGRDKPMNALFGEGNWDYFTQAVQTEDGMTEILEEIEAASERFMILGIFDLRSATPTVTNHMVGIAGLPDDDGVFDPANIVASSAGDRERLGNPETASAYSMENLKEIRIIFVDEESWE